MKKFSKLALVAIVPRKKDWKILQKQHWYRIPVKSAPKITTKIKYIAFYLPRIFDEDKFSVKYYAQVKKIKIVKRIELLPDEKEHNRASDDYYKLIISELRRLPKPIVSKHWRRITFIPTTLSRLFSAEEINDLWCTSPIEEILYKKMKREKIPAERQFFVYETKTPYCLDFAIFCRDGKLNVECNGDEYHSQKKTKSKTAKEIMI
ncbi:MAG: hypothetical protein ABIK61_03490 [candidate division WOR-3 bacterium]